MNRLQLFCSSALIVCFASASIQSPLSGQESAPPTDIPNTQPLEIPFTPPVDALAGIELPLGFTATLFASEPDVHQPIAVTTDSRGRLWVAECYTYSDNSDNYNTELNDRIVIFEDTNNDGKFDKRTVFWDQAKKLTGIEVGMGGVWVTCAPELLFIPDRDHNDVPDSDPLVMLNGFNDHEIRHNIVNGLRWGPDGWLYGRHGIQATSFVGHPNATESQRVAMNCAIWRFHPTAKKFEIVAQGGTNPWGFDYDENGEMFLINTVIGHLFHVVPGARYRRMYGAHFNRYTYQIIEQTADHFHWDQTEEHWAVTKKAGMSDGTDAAGGGHAHTGLMIYQGGNWPDEYRNSLFTANFHGRRLNRDTIHREGNSYTARHAADFMNTNDPWFRGVEMIYGPDGGVYLLDWSDIGECHENDGIHRTSGRIFKLVYGTPLIPAFDDLRKKSDDELIGLLKHKNEWFARKARRLLQERAVLERNSVDGLKTKLKRAIETADTHQHHLRLMWAMYSIGGADEGFLIKQTDSANEHVRSWAVRLLADGLNKVSDLTATRFLELAGDDPSGLVRLYLASSLGRLDSLERFELVEALSKHANDANDRVQPHLLWFGIEPAILSDPRRAIVLAKKTQIPLLRENIVRRLTEAISDEKPNPDFESIADWLNATDDSSQQIAILKGMNAGLNGWVSAPAPKNWESISKSLTSSNNENIKSLTQQLDVVFGNGRAIESLKRTAQDKTQDIAARRKAIELVGAKLESDDSFVFLRSLINDKAVTEIVTKTLVHTEHRQAANIILNRFRYMTPDGKLAAINTLTSRDHWSLALLKAIENGKIGKSFVTAWHARQMKNFQNPKLNERLIAVWGEIRDTSEEKKQQMEAVRKLVSDADTKVDLENGKQLFEKSCASCHTLYGSGGTTAPDLTGSNRKNLYYLLENIIDPSASVAESYRASVFQLDDGRLLTGVIVEENDRTVKLQTKDELIALDLQTVENRRQTKLSLMPDGLLDQLSEEQIANLFGFLSKE